MLNPMKLRQHKGGYDESMATTVELESTKAALLQAITNSGLIRIPNPLTEDQIHVEPVKIDSRNGWNTHIVTIQGWGVYGYTDGPLNPGTFTSFGVAPINALTPEEAQAKRPDYPFATSPFDEEPRPPEIARDHTVMHQTVGGKGAIGRIK